MNFKYFQALQGPVRTLTEALVSGDAVDGGAYPSSLEKVM